MNDPLNIWSRQGVVGRNVQSSTQRCYDISNVWISILASKRDLYGNAAPYATFHCFICFIMIGTLCFKTSRYAILVAWIFRVVYLDDIGNHFYMDERNLTNANTKRISCMQFRLISPVYRCTTCKKTILSYVFYMHSSDELHNNLISNCF